MGPGLPSHTPSDFTASSSKGCLSIRSACPITWRRTRRSGQRPQNSRKRSKWPALVIIPKAHPQGTPPTARPPTELTRDLSGAAVSVSTNSPSLYAFHLPALTPGRSVPKSRKEPCTSTACPRACSWAAPEGEGRGARRRARPPGSVPRGTGRANAPSAPAWLS